MPARRYPLRLVWDGEVANDGGVSAAGSTASAVIGAAGPAHERFGAVLRAAAEYAIIGTDLSGLIVVFNEGAERMLGYRAEEVLGKATPALFHDPDEVAARAGELGMAPGFDVLVADAHDGTPAIREWTCVRKDGTRLPVSVTVAAMRGEVGELTGFIGVARDLTEGRRTAAQLARLRHQQELILEAAAEGICGLDLEGRITFANPAAARMTGYTPEALIGQHFHDTLHYARIDGTPYPRAMCPTQATLDDGVVHRAEDDVFWRRDGTSFPVTYVSAPIRENGRIIGVVVIFQDISERKAVEADRARLLAQERAAQASAERLKDEFLANVSHDLRTPIAAIKASMSVVLANAPADLPAPLRRLLVNVDLAADRMAQLVGDLLELTRVQAGRVEAHLDRCDLRQVVLRATNEVEPLAQARRQRVERIVPPDPVWAIVDAERIERALLNLLSNAHKYGREGGWIQVRLEARAGEALVAVADDGPGIPEADQARIFQRFYRQRTAAVQAQPGSGLGLAIAQAMVQLHGGRIWVESAPGAGATFCFTLPLPADATRGPAAAAATAGAAMTSRLAA